MSDVYRVEEKMLGMHDAFDYFRCGRCGCVQIASIPVNLEHYYPEHYYSLRRKSLPARVSSELSILRARWLPGILPAKRPEFVPPELDRRTEVLEIGCGRGDWVVRMYRSGFRNVHGADPFMADEHQRRVPFRLERTTIAELLKRPQRYGFIYLSHALEHMPDQEEALRSVRELLEPDGTLCLRLPWVSSEAWEIYGVNWVQWDAPRHLYLHSRESLQRLIEMTGFRTRKLWCDSTSFQFWASEQYKLDIPLFREDSYLVSPGKSRFGAQTVKAFEARAKALNDAERGDQINVWLVRA